MPGRVRASLPKKINSCVVAGVIFTLPTCAFAENFQQPNLSWQAHGRASRPAPLPGVRQSDRTGGAHNSFWLANGEDELAAAALRWYEVPFVVLFRSAACQ
jgi:hypothetical protein